MESIERESLQAMYESADRRERESLNNLRRVLKQHHNEVLREASNLSKIRNQKYSSLEEVNYKLDNADREDVAYDIEVNRIEATYRNASENAVSQLPKVISRARALQRAIDYINNQLSK
jgi:DNA repair ATPase RecN